MGQVNLYKIDNTKKIDFQNNLYEKYEIIGKKIYKLSYSHIENNYNVVLYIHNPIERKFPEWKWILDEFNYEIEEKDESPRAILVIENKDDKYAVTYGFSYFSVDKYCDVDFAFDFARRVEFKQIKTTTLTAPNSQRNKMINVYLNYNEISFDSGEAYAKIKVKIKREDNSALHSEIVEIGHSIRSQLSDNNVECILKFIEYVETIRKKDERYKIPLFNKVKDEKSICKLDRQLLEKIEENMECINISELDIVGVEEVFNNNDSSFTLKYRRKSKNIEELTRESVLEFIDQNRINIKNDFFDIRVVSYRNGEQVYENKMKRLIDFTDDKRRCLLLNGEWYYFNDDYVQYLQDSIAELDVIYDPRFDFSNDKLDEYINRKYEEEKECEKYKGKNSRDIKKEIKRKYYAERVYNNMLSEQFGFENHDRSCDETEAGKIELMDLYKDRTMFAVKIGNSSAKLSYVVEQSIGSARLYKHHMLENMPKIDKIAVWIVLKNHKHLPEINGKPDISSLKMIMLKNRLDSWKKEVRILGYTPVVYLNYWEK